MCHYTKTVVDFWINRDMSNTVSIIEELEVVEEYKYLRVHLDSRLNRRINSEAVYKKGTEQTVLCE